MRAIVCGWFSFELMGATAGDLMTGELVCEWLAERGIPADFALHEPFEGGVDWREVTPSRYTHFVFICGPFGENEMTRELLDRFAHCTRLGLNLSMLQDPREWNPFDVLLERDSVLATRADLSFACTPPRVPVVGIILVKPQKEYGKRGRHEEIKKSIRALLRRGEVAPIWIDTRLDDNAGGLSSSAQIESAIAKMDAVITTRLHGTALSLKNGVPPLVIDPIAGGAKVAAQCRELAWPHLLSAEAADEAQLAAGLARVLEPQARRQVSDCVERARQLVAEVHQEFLRGLDEIRAERPA